jgi:photosystem II stability/assembly factor-like uncharacterized protein
LALDLLSPSTIYAGYVQAGAGGILRSTDRGQTWAPIHTSGFNGAIAAVDPQNPSVLYAAYSDFSDAGTIFKSTDAGLSWKPSNGGLAYPNLRVLAIDPAHPSAVYTGGPGGVFETNDAGGSWINLATFHVSSGFIGLGAADVHSLLVDFKNPNILYAETLRVNGCAMDDNTVFKSTDGGATWSDRVSPPGSGCLLGGYGDQFTLMAMDPVNPNTLYLGETESEDGIYALLKSMDGGINWTSIWNGANGLQAGLYSLAIDPVTPTTLYAGVGTGVFKSTDGGVSWSVTAVKDAFVAAITIDRTDPSVVYAGGSPGMFKSTDGGTSWVAINSGLDGLAGANAAITAVVIAPNDSNIVYLATSGAGIYRSVDGGGNWVKFDDGLTSLNVRALAIVPGTPTTLYAATPAGAFRAVDTFVTKFPADTQAPWQEAIRAMKTAAGTDSLNFWQWAWFWQYLPPFSGAPAGFGVVGSISPDVMARIISAGGGDALRNVSAELWVLYFRQVVPS